MTFYQELQLSSAGSKQLIKNTKDAKEKRKHILIYNFKVYLVMVFCVAVVTIFSKLLGSANSVVGVTVLLAVLVLRQADFGIKTSHGLLSIMGIYAILIAGPRLSNMVPPFAAFLINIVCIMLLMIMGCHNVIMYNHSTFVLLRKAGESEEYNGMGTTLVVASIFDNTLRVANVGDSRLYVIGEDIIQITRDHSWVEEMVQRGEIDRKAARTHEKKNVITRAIGGYDTVEAEMFSVDLKKEDMILMCSDGLTNMLEDQEIFHIIKSSHDIREAAERLVSRANDNGGRDNISVILIEP